MSREADRCRGVLWGQAVGDALGTTLEFRNDLDPLPFPELNAGPLTDVVGGGPFDLDPGQVTDDTHMAVCLAASLAGRGLFDVDDVARRYVEWSRVTFDIGGLTRQSLGRIAQGTPALNAGFVAWEAGGRKHAPNGSLMRCSPLPVHFRSEPTALREAALADSAITHADPRCRLACAAFGAAVRHALVDERATPESMRQAARAEVGDASGSLGPRTPPDLVKSARADLQEDLDLAARPDPELVVTRQAGFVRIAFRLAFWELLHAPSFEAALLDCANRGGDADTNAAIAGALYGSLVGESGIPAAWRDRVAGACRGPKWTGSPFADRYHPLRLFDLLSAQPL